MVSNLRVEDIPLFLEIVEKGYKEIYNREISPSHFLNSWTTLIQAGAGEILVAHSGDEIQAFLGYCIGDNFFEEASEIDVLFIYVLPSHRGQRVIMELMQFLEGMGLAINLYLNTDRYTRYLAKCGYMPESVVYRRGK